MKKCLNISLILIVLIISCSLSCSRWSEQPTSQDPNYYDSLWGDSGTTSQVPTFEMNTNVTEPPYSGTLSPALVSVNESGSMIISRIYPWDECGIVQLDKIMPKEVKLNEQINYTIKITNLTDTLLSGIIVKEEYPNSFRLISTNPTASREDTDKLTWEIETLGPKATWQITVSGIADYAEPLNNCTTVLTPVIPACGTMQVVQPSLKLVKDIPSEALLCDLIPVKYIVTNDGTGTISNIRIVDTLPSGLRTTEGKGEIAIDAGTLVENQSREYTVELRAAKVGKYTSKAIANSNTTGLRTESAETTTLVSQPVLTISKIGPERLYIGRPVTYEIIVTNKSDVTARDIVLEDAIPEGVDSIKATSGAQFTEAKLIWKIDSIGPNSSETFTISYTPNKPGTIINSATVTAYCTETVSTSMKTVVTGIPAVMLEVGDLDDPVRIGNRATYMITVTNQGSAISTNINIRCILEDNVKYISSAGATKGSMEGSTLRFVPLASLGPQEKAVWRIVVAAVRPGDVRFKVILNSDELTRPVEESEATHLYE